MVPTGEEFTYDCQLAFIAAGFTGCENYVADAFGVELTPGAMWPTRTSDQRGQGIRLRRYAPGPEPCGVGSARGPRLRRRGGPLPDGLHEPLICHSLSYPKQAEAGALQGSRFCFCAEENKKPPHPALCTRVRRFGGICPEWCGTLRTQERFALHVRRCPAASRPVPKAASAAAAQPVVPVWGRVGTAGAAGCAAAGASVWGA